MAKIFVNRKINRNCDDNINETVIYVSSCNVPTYVSVSVTVSVTVTVAVTVFVYL